MKQVFIKQGQAVIEELPAPQLEAGTVLVQVSHSCISTGTELSGVKSSGMPLWKRVAEDPTKIMKTFRMVADKGLGYTRDVVQGAMSTGTPSGYSAAGTVIAVGADVAGIHVGDRVACAGAQFAHHAEIIRVPINLVIPIPPSVDFSAASTVALGAIAMQGVRRTNPTLGEAIVVIGLGFLGQLTAQMLRLNGCRVLGLDLDPKRVQLALSFGMEAALTTENALDEVKRLTDGVGADGVIVTAATSSSEVMSTAFQMCRRKGRVILVGDVGLDLKRADIYQKELDFLISTSYGPGRYDKQYEEQGLEYPIAYVRWTEARNMAEYLRLIGTGHLQVVPLIGRIFPVDDATAAYEALQHDPEKPLIALLSYPDSASARAQQHTVSNPKASPKAQDKVRLALVGVGEFAKGVHLPNLVALADSYAIHAVMSRTGHNAAEVVRKHSAQYATTDIQQVLSDSEVDAVLISTRHHLHGSLTLQALQAGKHVFVEKPLALTLDEMNAIEAFYQASTPSPVLLTGFNRRFSPYAQRLQNLLQDRREPIIINYRMNAGYIPLDHWVHGAEGGGRNLGEACHIYDLFTFLVNRKTKAVTAHSIAPSGGYYSARDNFVAVITFEDSSIATLTYTALGSRDYPKEHLEVYAEGKALVMEDYRQLRAYGVPNADFQTKSTEKGHRQELEAFANTIQQGGDWPIPLWQQLQATQIAFEVERQL
ncbi:MAG: bi-domain-containing oxidoreductase [Anaerolineales bacterium]|nr:bi-domain-containing oxidoreductase [Anaerolineales bacterium]